MSDIAEFLLARIAEDERAAGGLQYDALVAQLSSPPLVMTLLGPYLARFDPARVLAECEAKRRIVESCQDAMEAGEIKPGTTWNDDAAGADVARETLCLLALPYAAHPDYDESWRP